MGFTRQMMRRISPVNLVVHQLAHSQMVRLGDRQGQSSVGHQAVIVEGDGNAVGRSGSSIRWVLLTDAFILSLDRGLNRSRFAQRRHFRAAISQ